MTLKERSSPKAPRAVWAAGALALLVLAGGGWWLQRAAGAPPAPPVASTTGAPAAPRAEAPAEPAVAPPPAAASVAAALPAASAAAPPPARGTSLPLPMGSPADELRKVQQALNGTATAQQMLEAATMLSLCPHADRIVESTFKSRDQPTPEAQQLEKAAGINKDQQIAWQQDLQRRCQVFDAATLARSGELFRKAHEGGAKNSALPYLQSLTGHGKPPVSPELLATLQREVRQTAEDGDFTTLLMYAHSFDPAPLGATPLQRQAYKEALFRIQREQSGEAMEKASRASTESLEKTMAQWIPAPPPLSAEQQREADALTKQIVDNWRRGQRKGG
jgi:hypothetical protein